MNRSTRLRYALLSNALFSGASALLLLATPARVGVWLGLDAPLVYRVVGAGLILFALNLLHQASRPQLATLRALVSSLADFAWVLSSVALLVLRPDLFSPPGSALIATVAVAVLGFGLWQLSGIAHFHRHPDLRRRSEYWHCVAVEVEVPADAMWRIVSDLGRIERYMPTLRTSRLDGTAQPGEGAIRTCEDVTGKRWSEQCISFETGRGFTVRFLADAPGFPFPARAMTGGWEIELLDTGSRVSVWWELAPKPALLAPLILPLLASRADRDFPAVIGRMAADAGTPRDSAERHPGKVEAPLPVRLLQGVC